MRQMVIQHPRAGGPAAGLAPAVCRPGRARLSLGCLHPPAASVLAGVVWLEPLGTFLPAWPVGRDPISSSSSYLANNWHG